jgi:Ner family transcriptional regulator
MAKGHTLASLAKRHGLHRNAVAKALRVPFPKMERLIAKKLGMQPEQIWPERYNADGTPNRYRFGRVPAGRRA